MNIEERNQFILSHFDTINDICKYIVAKVRCKYSSVTRDDLTGYAMEGIINAVGHADVETKNWKAYLYQYAYTFALAGAMEVLGLKRSRKDGKSQLKSSPLTFRNTDELIILSDASFKNIPIEYQKIFIRHEIDWLIRCLKPSLERYVLIMLIRKKTIRQIARTFAISTKKVRRTVEKIAIIYQLALNHQPYEHLLSKRQSYIFILNHKARHIPHHFVVVPKSQRNPPLWEKISKRKSRSHHPKK